MTKEEMVKKFNKESIAEITDRYLKEKRTMIHMLHHLEVNGRFREVEGYEDASFQRYIEDKFNLSLSAYHKEVRIFSHWPDIATHPRIGVGVVRKILDSCPKRYKPALEEICEIPENEISRDRIDKVIYKYEKTIEAEEAELKAKMAELEAEKTKRKGT